MKRRAVLALVGLALAGCGGDENGGSSEDKPRVTVSAAASLKAAFTDYAKGFDKGAVRFSFAGSDQLAAQIREGVRPDVYAAANTQLPDALFGKGLVEKPKVFAANRLVIAVPAGAANVRSLDDLQAGGVKLVIGAEDVPVGSYTRELLSRLPDGRGKAILANVRSEEPDVSGIVGKLTQGSADAGFVYVTDVRAAGGKLKAIELAKSLSPSVKYGAAVVKGAKEPGAARAFVEGLVDGAGREALDAAGFEGP